MVFTSSTFSLNASATMSTTKLLKLSPNNTQIYKRLPYDDDTNRQYYFKEYIKDFEIKYKKVFCQPNDIYM